ncbi:MAG: hypothetical protein U0L74_04000 [Paludibacteraceae bacterium]|nr:hypothetical protein [Paludibacteraceae bacterium]
MKKNSTKEEKVSFFEHSEKDLRKARTGSISGSILLDVIIRIRRTYFYRKYGLYVIVLIMGLLIYSMIKDVDDSLLNLGISPQMGLKGYIFMCFLLYLSLELFSRLDTFDNFFRGIFRMPFLGAWVSRNDDLFCILFLNGIFLMPFLGALVWIFIYNNYCVDRYNEIMKEKNVVSGIVYGKHSYIEDGNFHYSVKIGYKHNKVYKFTVFTTADTYQNIDIRDSILIFTSREYPQVMEVANWHPTKEQKERYKIPRKFKSLFFSKIEEEVPDSLQREGKDIHIYDGVLYEFDRPYDILDQMVEQSRRSRKLQLEEHEHDEGVESADIADISNEVEDESIELEEFEYEFEYEFQPEKKKQVEENRVIDVRLNVIEKHE